MIHSVYLLIKTKSAISKLKHPQLEAYIYERYLDYIHSGITQSYDSKVFPELTSSDKSRSNEATPHFYRLYQWLRKEQNTLKLSYSELKVNENHDIAPTLKRWINNIEENVVSSSLNKVTSKKFDNDHNDPLTSRLLVLSSEYYEKYSKYFPKNTGHNIINKVNIALEYTRYLASNKVKFDIKYDIFSDSGTRYLEPEKFMQPAAVIDERDPLSKAPLFHDNKRAICEFQIKSNQLMSQLLSLGHSQSPQIALDKIIGFVAMHASSLYDLKCKILAAAYPLLTTLNVYWAELAL